MSLGVLLGSNFVVAPQALLTVVSSSGQRTEFLKVHAIPLARQTGDRWAVDVDIKDADGQRELKTHKGRPLQQLLPAGYTAEDTPERLEVRRPDGSVVLRVEQLSVEAAWKDFQKRSPARPGPPPGDLPELTAALRITGDFMAGGVRISATEDELRIGASTVRNTGFYCPSAITITEGGGLRTIG